MGLSLDGSYCVLNLAADSRKRSICGSVFVAHWAARYRRKNIKMPPSKLESMLNVAAPMHMAKKKSFLSTPRTVSGRWRVRYTVLILLAWAMSISSRSETCLRSRKEPSEEIDCGDGHANAEQNASHDSF